MKDAMINYGDPALIGRQTYCCAPGRPSADSTTTGLRSDTPLALLSFLQQEFVYLNLLAVSYVSTKYLLEEADEEPAKGKRTFRTA